MAISASSWVFSRKTLPNFMVSQTAFDCDNHFPLFFLTPTIGSFQLSLSLVPLSSTAEKGRGKGFSHRFGNITNRLHTVCLGDCFLQKSLSIDHQVPTPYCMTPLWKISYRY